jgi:hypothetical protein
LWLTVSNAFFKSKKIPQANMPYSMAIWILLFISSSAWLVEGFDRNPYCPWNIVWVFFKKIYYPLVHYSF